jgi:hypothetical protein
MAYPILGTPVPAFFDSSGLPLVSGTITTQDPDDDSVKASYPTAADADASTNGTSGNITLNARGEPTSTQYWGRDGNEYKVIIKDSSGATLLSMTSLRLPGHSRRSAVTFTSGDSTPTIIESDTFITAGTTAITDFDGGQVGDVRRILAASTITITHGSPVSLLGEVSFNMVAGDTLTLAMFNDQVWEEVSRSTATTTLPVIKTETVTTTNVITAAETGTTYFLNLAGGFTSTLPAPAAGLNYKFIIKTAPTTTYVITTTSGSNLLYGTFLDIVGELTYFSAQDTLNFVGGSAAIGDKLEVQSDGTNWYCTAFSGVNGGITVAVT